MSVRAALFLVGLAALPGVAACGDDDQVGTFADAPGNGDALPDAIVRFDAPVGDPTGGWQMGALYACFGSSNQADFGDSSAAVATTPCCSWDQTGLLYYPNTFGTWTLDASGRLIVTEDPPCGEFCGPFAYERNEAVTCSF